jgi:FtsZ-binding cell division protein ZapB
MNRKFVKENKQALREFFKNAIINLITKGGNKAIDNAIEKNPRLKQHRKDLNQYRKDLEKVAPKLKKSHPELYNLLNQI